MPFQSRIKALSGLVGEGVTLSGVRKRYYAFKEHVVGSDISQVVWRGVVIEVALCVAHELLRQLSLGRLSDRKEDKFGAYVESEVSFGADSYIIRIRESEDMETRVAFILPARLNNGRELRWVHPHDQSAPSPQAVSATQKPAAPAAQATSPVSSSTWPEGWGEPGPGGVNVANLRTEYQRVKRVDYRGSVPANSVAIAVHFNIAATLAKELPFKGEKIPVATAIFDGDEVNIYLMKELLEGGRTIGFQIRNIPGKPPEKKEWRWPGFRVEEITQRLPKVPAVAQNIRGLKEKIPNFRKRPQN